MNTHVKSAAAGILGQAAKTPPVIDVCDYVQARETEVRYLLHAVKEDVGETSFGASFLPRHLRRRATSYRRFNVRHRPNLRLAALYGSKISVGDVPLVVAKRARIRDAVRTPGAAAPGAEDAGIREQLQQCKLTGAAPGHADVDGGIGTGDSLVQARPSTVTTARVRPTNREMRRRPARLQSAAEASCARDLVAGVGSPEASQQHAMQNAEWASQFVGRDVDHLSITEPNRNGDAAATTEAAAAHAVQAASELRRLETHVWHSRRMAMERSWGHLLASHAVGRGRGSRSLLASLRRMGPRVRPGGPGGGALLHDSSYLGCVELRGHQRCLADILRRISDPISLDALLDRPEVISGAIEWDLFVHRPGAFPLDPLAPARALWLTPASRDEGQDGEQTQTATQTGSFSFRHAPALPVDIDAEGWATRCVLWLWVHAAAFRDVYEALHSAAEAVMPEGGATTFGAAASRERPVAGYGGHAVSIRSRCPDLRRIDLVGDTATACLARVLMPVERMAAGEGTAAAVGGGGGGGGAVEEGAGGQATRPGTAVSPANPPHLDDADDFALGGRLWRSLAGRSQGGAASGKHESGQKAGRSSEAANLNWFWRWPAGAALGMVVADPRLAAPVRLGGGVVCADALTEATGRELQHSGSVNACGVGGDAVRELPCLDEEELRHYLQQWPEAGDWTAGAAMLWRTAAGPSVRPPLEQSKVASIRHAARKRVLRAGLDLDLGVRHMDVLPMSCGGSQVAAAEARETSRGSDGSTGTGGADVSFPVLLVRRPEGRTRRPAGHGDGSCGGWSLVLPARWVMPVWTALAFAGVRPTGQSEWRQLATHFRTPCFPYDHPYTPAGMRHNREALAKMSDAASRRPMGRARKPRDLGPVADWTRLMQSSLPGRQLPSSLRGGKTGHTQGGGPRAADDRHTVGMDVAGEGGCSASGTPLAVVDAGAHPAAALVVAASARTTASPGSMSEFRWALALSGSTLRSFLANGGDADRDRHAIGMGAAQQALCRERQRGQQPVRGRQPANKDCLHGWSLRKALRLGLVAPKPPCADALKFPPQQKVIREAEGQHVGAMAMKSGGIEARKVVGVPGPGPGPQRGTRCLLYAAVKIEGKGVCEAGAEIICRYRTVQGASSEETQQQEVVLGFVVSAVTRGSPVYPGGLALCDAAGLANLAGAAESSGRRSDNIPTLRLWLRNPVSTALRACRVEVLMPGDQIPQKPGAEQQLAWN
ncbi:hypothetical protein VaNZ11_003669 [Volvox africanus]|uniref:POPLD domain-containing protein n=1 Tax=Volvox africanus TaxID=51714 RepID=A0ABQ5RVL8_9CHLO|nr:hypothetical protein VaNZ11_003669 [Volvox africanus]